MAEGPMIGQSLGRDDFSTRRTTTVACNLGTIGPGLTASRDGRTVLFSRVDSSINELMLVENFR